MARSHCRGLAGAALGLILFGAVILVAVLLIRTYTLPERRAVWRGAPAQEARLDDEDMKQIKQALVELLQTDDPISLCVKYTFNKILYESHWRTETLKDDFRWTPYAPSSLPLLVGNIFVPEANSMLWGFEKIPGTFHMVQLSNPGDTRLLGAIRIPTVSFSDEEQNFTALAKFGDYIREVFPLVFSSSIVQYEVVAQYSHLFTVQGSNPSLMPYMMLAHLDVVPAPADDWDFPPFSGEEHNGYIYGRGALDDKSSVIGILQALEFLLKTGYQPRRSFYIGLGHDEEVSGHEGAMNIVEILQNRGIKLLYVVDEGLAVLDGIIQGVKKPVALIGTTEKGSITLNLTVNQPPGHSSMPSAETSIGILATAVSRLEKNPMPNMFGHGPEASMFEHLGREFYFPINVMMANLWLFSPVVSRVLEKTPSSNAIVRTTTATTIFHSGLKSNVIPAVARATVNFRLHPAQTVDEVLDIVRNTISDERVKLSVLNSFNPLPVSPYDETSFGFQILQHTIHSVFSGAPVAPGVCVGNTDSRHFVNLTNNIYRFSPFQLQPQDVSRIHGLNERISVDNLRRLVQFYYQLIQNSDYDIDNVQMSHQEIHEL